MSLCVCHAILCTDSVTTHTRHIVCVMCVCHDVYRQEMASALAAAEQAAASKLTQLTHDHSAALAAQAAASAAAQQGLQQQLAAAQAAHQQQLLTARSTAAVELDSTLAALKAQHEAALEHLGLQRRAAEQAADAQVSLLYLRSLSGPLAGGRCQR